MRAKTICHIKAFCKRTMLIYNLRDFQKNFKIVLVFSSKTVIQYFITDKNVSLKCVIGLFCMIFLIFFENQKS